MFAVKISNKLPPVSTKARLRAQENIQIWNIEMLPYKTGTVLLRQGMWMIKLKYLIEWSFHIFIVGHHYA